MVARARIAPAQDSTQCLIAPSSDVQQSTSSRKWNEHSPSSGPRRSVRSVAPTRVWICARGTPHSKERSSPISKLSRRPMSGSAKAAGKTTSRLLRASGSRKMGAPYTKRALSQRAHVRSAINSTYWAIEARTWAGGSENSSPIACRLPESLTQRTCTSMETTFPSIGSGNRRTAG